MEDLRNVSRETAYELGYVKGLSDAVVHGKWLFPTKIGGRAWNIPHCSACEGVPCGTDENTKYCAICGARMDLE